ncbi:TPA: hypothetical protein ACNJ4A_000527 [Citrobacter freundii]
MTLYEMEGFLRGKCLPGDMMVNESNAQYLVRKFSELQSQNAELAEQLANAESKCRELAAENSGLNVFIEEECFVYSSDTPEPIDANDCRPETPATDAFLAEVRAQGVERMIEVKQQQLDGMHPDTFAISAVRDSIRRDIYELKVFAEILRQEASQ